MLNMFNSYAPAHAHLIKESRSSKDREQSVVTVLQLAAARALVWGLVLRNWLVPYAVVVSLQPAMGRWCFVSCP